MHKSSSNDLLVTTRLMSGPCRGHYPLELKLQVCALRIELGISKETRAMKTAEPAISSAPSKIIFKLPSLNSPLKNTFWLPTYSVNEVGLSRAAQCLLWADL